MLYTFLDEPAVGLLVAHNRIQFWSGQENSYVLHSLQQKLHALREFHWRRLQKNC
jgi:hypothetical protein